MIQKQYYTCQYYLYFINHATKNIFLAKLSDPPSAAEVDVRAGDVPRLVGEEEADGRHGVLELTDVAGRNLLHHAGQLRFGGTPRIDETRRDGVDRDAIWRQRLRQPPDRRRRTARRSRAGRFS